MVGKIYKDQTLEIDKSVDDEKASSSIKRSGITIVSLLRKWSVKYALEICSHCRNCFTASNSEIVKRFIVGTILGVVMLSVVIIGEPIFSMLIVLIAVLMSFEWSDMIASDKTLDRAACVKWKVFGVLYICVPSMSMIFIRHMHGGLVITVWYMLTVWATDSIAYFAGKALQGKKLCPSISPNKTYSGAIGGIVGGLVMSMLIFISIARRSVLPWHSFMFLSVIVTCLSQVGDLLESFLKRRFNIKDSGAILPGHGGIMDRMDSIVIVAPFVFLAYFWCGRGFCG